MSGWIFKGSAGAQFCWDLLRSTSRMQSASGIVPWRRKDGRLDIRQLLCPSEGGINSFEFPGWATMRVSCAAAKRKRKDLC